jgi:FkbM family methyltransferase
VKLLHNFFEFFGIFFMKTRTFEEIMSLPSQIESTLLKISKGVVHVGGHRGEEAKIYSDFGLRVLWFEGLPEYFTILNDEISQYPKQKALNYFLSDSKESKVPFYLSNNDRNSSSFFRFGTAMNQKDLAMDAKILVETERLDGILSAESLVPFNHLVIDVQGAELSVLKGAGNLISCFSTLKIEVSTRAVYEGAALYDEVATYLLAKGFFPLFNPQSSHTDVFFINSGHRSLFRGIST